MAVEFEALVPGARKRVRRRGTHWRGVLAPYVCRLDTRCWEWIRPLSCGAKYARLRENGRDVRAHRWFWEQAGGVLGEGEVLHHVCRNSLCVNPEHLVAMDRREHARMHMLERQAAIRAA